MVIALKKWSQFEIEYSQNCDFDYIEIFDGPDTTARSMGRYCGNQAPKYIRSTGSSLTLSFITDEWKTSPGFTVEWAETPGPKQGCGGIFDVKVRDEPIYTQFST